MVSNIIHFCNYLDYEMALSEQRAAKKVPFMNHQEAQQHLNMADRPAYMELPVMHWLEARGLFDPQVQADTGPGHRFPWPPMHLFWGGSQQSRHSFSSECYS